MAVTIQPTSNIKSIGESTVYINAEDFTGDLFFTETAAKHYYFILVDGVVKRQGVLESVIRYAGKYAYRYNFNNLINIQNQKIPTLTQIAGQDIWYSTSTISNKVVLFISTNPNFLEENIDAGYFYVSNGIIYDEGAEPVANYIYDYHFNINFVDKQDDRGYSYPASVKQGKIFTTSIFYDWKLLKVQYMNGNGVFGQFDLSSQAVNNIIQAKTFYITIPENEGINGVKMEFFKSGLPSEWIIIKGLTECVNPYYFINQDGVMDTLNCTGNKHLVESVDKEYLNINGKQIPRKINITKQIKQNTGLALSSNELYSLIKTPIVYTLDADNVFKKYTLDNSTFEGYNGINLSERNTELIMNDVTKSNRLTNFNINFFD